MTFPFLPAGTRCTQCFLMHYQPAANFPLTPRVCRRKRNFIFEDMPEITGMTPLNVMLLECGKKELYNWTLAQLWTYLDKMGYDLYIDAIPQRTNPITKRLANASLFKPISNEFDFWVCYEVIFRQWLSKKAFNMAFLSVTSQKTLVSEVVTTAETNLGS